MLYKRQFLFLIRVCVFLIIFPVFSQNSTHVIDSIVKISKTKTNDSLTIEYLHATFFNYSYSQPEVARLISEKALIQSENIHNNYLICRSLLRKGIYYDIISKKDSAILEYDKAYKVASKSNDKQAIASVYNNKGLIAWDRENFKEAMDYYLLSLEIFKELNQARGQANNLNNIGLLLSELHRTEESIKYHKKSLRLRKKIKDKYGIGASYTNLSENYSNLNKIDSSIYFTYKAINIKKEINDYRGLGISYNNLGLEYKQTNKIDSAFYYLKKADGIYKKLNTNKLRAINLFEIGEIHQKFGREGIAIKNYKKALGLLEKSELISRLKIIKKLAFSYSNEKKYRLSALNFQKAVALQDSVTKKNEKLGTQEIFEKYQSEKKEKQLLAQKVTLAEGELIIQKRNNLVIGLISLSIILAILSLFYIYKQRQKNLFLQNENDLKDALAKERTLNRLQEQRLRISRDLHDNVGSQLTFIISSIDSLKFIVDQTSKKYKEKLTQITAFSRETIDQLRDTIWAMNQENINFESFQTRILSYIEKAKISNEKIEIKFINTSNQQLTFSSMKGVNIFRVIQEAVNNAIKYANAETIIVKLHFSNSTFFVSIIDDGQGFNLKEVNMGNGIENMYKRINEIGCKLVIKTEENQGTSIIIACDKNTINNV